MAQRTISNRAVNMPKAALEHQLHEHMRKEYMARVAAQQEAPHSCMNNWAKFIVTQANFLFLVMGIVIIAGSLYALLEDFGDLDKGFFIGGGTMFFLFGVIVLILSYLGSQGIFYQSRESKFTSWRGSRILSIYQVFLVATLVFELLWVGVSLDALALLRTNAEAVTNPSIENPPMSSMEIKIAEKFDAFFFGASSQCETAKYEWFWGFINTRCTAIDENMSQLTCQRCDDYSVTACTADNKACYNGMGEACPYQACRAGILQFILDRFPPFSYFVIAMVVFQIILILSNCTLICYHRRDTDAEIKAKNGIFAQRQAGGGDTHPTHRQLPPNSPAHRGTSQDHHAPQRPNTHQAPPVHRGGSDPRSPAPTPHQGGPRGPAPRQGGPRGPAPPPHQGGPRGPAPTPRQGGPRGPAPPPHQGGPRGPPPPPQQGGPRGPPHHGGRGASNSQGSLPPRPRPPPAH